MIKWIAHSRNGSSDTLLKRLGISNVPHNCFQTVPEIWAFNFDIPDFRSSFDCQAIQVSLKPLASTNKIESIKGMETHRRIQMSCQSSITVLNKPITTRKPQINESNRRWFLDIYSSFNQFSRIEMPWLSRKWIAMSQMAIVLLFRNPTFRSKHFRNLVVSNALGR